MTRRHPSGGRVRTTVATAHTAETVMALIMIALLVAAVLVSKSPTVETATTVSVSVRPGDTLWSLAKAHPVPGLDTAQSAQVIAELNEVAGSTLIAGSVIHVPASVPAVEGVAMR